MKFNFKDMSEELRKIMKFNIKFKRQIELKDNKKKEVKNANKALGKLEEKLTTLGTEELQISADLPSEDAKNKIEENKSNQEKLNNEIAKKKEKISALEKTYKTYEDRYLKLYSEKKSALIDLDVKIAKLEDKLDDLRNNWSKAADKLNENYSKMRKLNKDSEEYKDLEEENEKHKEIMKNNIITSETGMKLQNELENVKNMRRILENGEIIEELLNEPAKEEPAKEEPAKEEPAKEEPVKEEPSKEEPAKEEPAKEEPAKEEPAKEEPAKEEPVKEEPVKEEPVKEEPAKKEPTKVEPEKTESTNTEPINTESVTLEWHKKLTQEQIEDAISRGIYEPKGPEYEQFLLEHGIKEINEPNNIIQSEGIVEKETNGKSIWVKVKDFFKEKFYSIRNIFSKQKMLPEGKETELKIDSNKVRQYIEKNEEKGEALKEAQETILNSNVKPLEQSSRGVFVEKLKVYIDSNKVSQYTQNEEKGEAIKKAEAIKEEMLNENVKPWDESSR